MHLKIELRTCLEIKEEDPELSPSTEAAIIKPNLNSIRKILGGDGTDQQRKVVEENTGLIPKYYKVSPFIFCGTFLTLISSHTNCWNRPSMVDQFHSIDAISATRTTGDTTQ